MERQMNIFPFKKILQVADLKKCLNEFGKKISEDHLIKFDFRVILLLGVAFLLFSLVLIFKIHGSSMSCWNTYVSDGNDKRVGLLLGTPKYIRSDEWATYTPNMLSQVFKGFPVKNKSIGGEKAPLFINSPVKHYTTFFRPQFWGFFIFDIERGFSFFWSFKTFGLFLSSFFVFLLLTRNNFWLSLFGASWIFLSGFIQWWFSVPFLPGMIASFNIIFITLIYMFLSKQRTAIILSSILFIIFSINFVMFFYLPFLIPLFYLLLFLTAGYLIKHFKEELFKLNMVFRIFSIIIAVTFCLFILAIFYIETRDTISLISQTRHPGIRSFKWGNLHLIKYFSGFFDMFYSASNYPKVWLNVCESSRFIILFPIVLLSFVINLFTKRKINFLRNNMLKIFILVYISILSIWLLWGLPPFLAKITFLNKVGARGFDGIGIASIMLVIIFLSKKKDIKKYSLIRNIALFSPIFLLLFIYGLSLMKLDDFFTIKKIIVVAFLFTILSYLLFHKKRLLFSLGILIIILPNILINPVSIGLDPLLDKNLSKYSREIAGKNPGAKWVVFSKQLNFIANFLMASGIEVVNGKIFPPHLDMMEILDPTLKYKNIYNRAAFISFFPNRDKTKDDEIIFKMGRTHFIYNITIDPCSKRLQEIGIKYFVFTYMPFREIHRNMFPLKRFNHIWICEYKPANNLKDSIKAFNEICFNGKVPDISSIKQDNSPTMAHIEIINGINIYKRKNETIILKNIDSVNISGYAVDRKAMATAGGVFIDIDGKIFPSSYGFSRRDVSRNLKLPSQTTNSGFRMQIPISEIGPGIHTLSIKILTKDRKSFYITKQKVRFEIKND